MDDFTQKVDTAVSRILRGKFFARNTVLVAKELLGKYLVRQQGQQTIARMITEVEAYSGFDDRASHASRGKTERNSIMFGSAGRWYVYLIYGVHNMLNIVTGPKDYPAAVLIRGVEGHEGPGVLTRELKITRAQNGKTAGRASGLWIEDRGVDILADKIKTRPRVGVAYAGRKWSGKKWNFSI